MKLSAGTGNRLSSLTYRTATFCDSGGGQPEHRENVPSDKGQPKGAAGQGERGGKGSGGVTPPPPPPPSRKRQPGEGEGGVAPPTVKAKSGDTPSAGASISPRQARYEAACKLLLAKGYTAFPRQDPGCAGNFQDLNEHRISVWQKWKQRQRIRHMR